MKTSKSVLTLLFTVLFMLTISSCKKCKNENPSARIINNGTEKVSVQIKTSGGNTVNINNVQANTSSKYESYAPGNVTFTIAVDNNGNFVEKVHMDDCYDYDIAIDKDNNISTFVIDRND
ncbi:hypothetical protein ERX46_09580 [Brumimicrobium glaciale]|jgi:hypothetical protein|uniref:Uncharacterized protein n=1 Tax=Brumimicrobium glaciale TaxID=200475 RepID=A0A4Q4KM59_9FLAO|nr:hypothetical protein [Brumimicrobium glaciale]RYM34198.1 hypothetical protein ERX46_09580 [Brumimicrobium glaciale]